MFRCARQTFTPYYSSRTRPRPTTRFLHRVTGDFINYDANGSPVSTKVPIVIGDPGQTFALVGTDIGRAFHTEPSPTSLSSKTMEYRCKVTFFHDSQHFGHGPSSYPRLQIPTNFPRQTASNMSPATLYLTGKMHDIVLDGTPDAKFSELANATGQNLQDVLDELKNR